MREHPTARAGKPVPVDAGNRGHPSTNEVRLAEIQRTVVALGQVGRVARHLVALGKYVVVFWFVRDAVALLAGKVTVASFMVMLANTLGEPPAVPWSLSTAMLLWALLERQLRRRAIRNLGNKSAELLRIIDIGRMRSGLAPDGQTNKEHE